MENSRMDQLKLVVDGLIEMLAPPDPDPAPTTVQ
jgi:hypothetical protein